MSDVIWTLYELAMLICMAGCVVVAGACLWIIVDAFIHGITWRNRQEKSN